MMVLHPFRAALWIIPLWAYRTVIGDHACLPEQQQLGEISAVLGFNRIGGTVLVPVGDDMFVCEVRAAGNDRSGIFCRHHDSKIVSYDQAEWQQIIALDSVITGLWVSNVQQTCYVAAVTKANLLIFSARKDPAISLLALDPVATSSNAYARAYPSLVIAPPPPQQSYRGPSIQLDHTDLTDNEEMPTQTPPPTPPPATSTTIGVTRLLKLDSIPVTEEQSAVTYVPGAKKIQILQPQEQTPYRGPPLYMDEEDVVDNDEVPTQTIPPVPVVISTTSQPVTIDRYLQLELLDLGEQRTTIVPGAKKIEIQQPRQQERYQSPSIYLGPADLEDNAEVPVQTPRLVSVVMSKPYGVDRYLQLDLLDVGEKGTTPGAKEIEIRPMSHYSSPALPLQQVILVPPQYNPPPILLPGIRYSNTSYNPSEYDEVAPPVAATPAAVMMVENHQLAPHPAAVPAYYPPQNSSLDGQSQVPLLPLILAQPEPYPTDNSNAAQYLSSGTPQVLFQAPNVHEVASPVAPYAPYFVQPSRLIPELDEDYAEFLMTRTTSPVPVESATYIDVPVAPVARLPDQELSHQTAPQVVAIANPIKSDASQIEEESEEELTPEVVATRGTVPAQDTMTPVETAYVVEQATVRPPGIHLTDEPIDRERDGDLAEDYADGREPAFVTSPTPEVYTGSEPPVVTETVDRVSYGDFDYEEVERPTTQQGSYPVQPPWTANETMRVNVPVSYIMPIPPQIDQFGFGVHHDDFDPTNMDFSEVPVAESGFSSYPPTAKSTSPSPVPAPPAIEQIGTTVLPVVRGVTGDADYEEIPMASWQHSQQVALPMSSPTWVFYNGSLPSAINALPDESQMIWSSIPPNGLNIPSQMADPSVPGIRASPEEAIEDDEADIESSFRPSQGSPISPNTNYSVGDRTMTLESVYGRPMVIVKTQPGENVTGPRVQVYLDETADVGQYLLNPVQFPAVLVQQIEHVEGSQSSLPFPLLGPVRSYNVHHRFVTTHRDSIPDQQQQSESPADLPPGSQSIGLNILDVPDEDYTEIQPGPPLPTVQPGTGPKNGTVQPAPGQFVSLSPSVEVSEALPSQPRVHYLDVNLNRDSIDLEDYSEVDVGKTSPPPTVPVAEFVPSSSSPIAPVPAIRYTNESGFDFHTEALDFAEYLHARQPSVELPLAPPKSVAQVEPASASMNLPLAPLGGSPSAPFPGIHYTNDSISRTHGHDADYDEALPVRPVSTPPSSPPVIQTVLPPAQPVVAPPSPPLPRLRHTNITAGDRDHYLSEDYSEMQYPPPVANNLASVTQQEPSPTTPAPPHEIAQGINNYDDRIPIAATTYPFIPVTYPPPTPVVYVQSQPGARRIEIRPAAVEMSVAPSRGYRWRKPPTTPSKADEGLHGPLSPPVTAPVPEWINRFGQRVPAPIQPKQEPAQSLPTPPALSSPQQKPPTRRNRFGQKIKVSLPEAAPSLPSFGLAPPQLPSDPSQQNTLMGYQLKFTGDLGQPRRNRFGQTVRPSSPNDLHLLRRDAGTKQGWIPMTAPEPPSSVPQLDRRQPTVNSPPAGITYGQMPYPIAQTDKTPPSPRNEKWNQNEYYSGQPEPPAAQTVPPSLTDPVTEAPTGSLISSLLVNKTWSETASPIVHNICQPGVVLEDRTITEFVDCEESDISELVITITPKNGSGSFHYEIVPEGDTPDAGKFSIDESNGEIYASATFSSKVDSWDADSLGPDLVYEVKVRVSDELCDQSDEAFMSIAFRCKDRSSPTEALAVKRPISRR